MLAALALVAVAQQNVGGTGAGTCNEGIGSETSDCRSLALSQQTLTHTGLTHSKGQLALALVRASGAAFVPGLDVVVSCGSSD